MQTIALQDMIRNSEDYLSVLNTLRRGGLVCIPTKTSYRILADLTNKEAVNRLLHSKRRTRKAPSLVFIPEYQMLKQVAVNICPQAKVLAKQLWPGELTIRFEPNLDLVPESIAKTLTKANGKIGVRVPRESWLLRLLGDLSHPLLVSSANREKKVGSSSPAQIRKNFMSTLSVFVDAGDIPPGVPSTVVNIENGEAVVTREGSIPTAHIHAIIRSFIEEKMG